MPIVNEWQENLNTIIDINGHEMKIIEADKGLDTLEKCVYTKLAVMCNEQRFVIHCYNTTQNLMIQGKHSDQFALNCLEPFFERRINNPQKRSHRSIMLSKQALKQKRKANTFNCAHCNIKTKTLPDLKVHMKMCHTKGRFKKNSGIFH